MTVVVHVQVRPGAGRRGLRGRLANGVLKLEVTEPPEGGKANAAVVELLAGLLGLKRAQVEVTRGHASRAKSVTIEGMSESDVNRRIEWALSNPEG